MISVVACCHSVKHCTLAPHSGFPISTKWCCDQVVKAIPGASFTKGTWDLL